jgi:hypothetical protein
MKTIALLALLTVEAMLIATHPREAKAACQWSYQACWTCVAPVLDRLLPAHARRAPVTPLAQQERDHQLARR